jgi:hypothetical protein
MKCSICGNKIEITFLGKVIGSYVKKKGSSKKYPICFECQKKYKAKEEMLLKIK